jgi:hypothetical protein
MPESPAAVAGLEGPARGCQGRAREDIRYRPGRRSWYAQEGRVCKELILSPAPRPPRAPLRARHPSTCSSRRRASTLGGALYSPRVFQCDKIEQAARHDMSRRGDQHRLHPAGTVAAALLTSTGLIVIGQYIQGLVVWCFTGSSKSYSEF